MSGIGRIAYSSEEVARKNTFVRIDEGDFKFLADSEKWIHHQGINDIPNIKKLNDLLQPYITEKPYATYNSFVYYVVGNHIVVLQKVEKIDETRLGDDIFSVSEYACYCSTGTFSVKAVIDVQKMKKVFYRFYPSTNISNDAVKIICESNHFCEIQQGVTRCFVEDIENNVRIHFDPDKIYFNKTPSASYFKTTRSSTYSGPWIDFWSNGSIHRVVQYDNGKEINVVFSPTKYSRKCAISVLSYQEE